MMDKTKNRERKMWKDRKSKENVSFLIKGQRERKG